MITKRNFLFLRMIAILFAICGVSFHARAQFAGGTGQADNPFQIATIEQLCSIGSDPNLLDKHFILVADIDLHPRLPGRRDFEPAVIAPDLNDKRDFQGPVFKGSFNGNGHVIKDLTIRSGKTGYIGLFGKIGSAGRVYNLRLEDIDISSSGKYIGGLVGYNNGQITNCRVSGDVLGGTEYYCSCLALLAGRNRGRISHCDINGTVSSGRVKRGTRFGLLTGLNDGVISNCCVGGKIVSEVSASEVGGLVGENLCSIADCYSLAKVSLDSSGKCGGLVGTNRGVIYRCYATSDVSCGKYSKNVGGLVGLNSGSVINCYASGDVSGYWQLGGLAGLNGGNIINCYAKGNVTGEGHVGGLVGNGKGIISHAYATGHVVGKDLDYIPKGGLLAEGYSHNVICCYWNIETSGQTTSEGGEGLNTAPMQKSSTFLEAGWDFVAERSNGTSDVWQMPESGGYPKLTFFSKEYQQRKLKGSGTSDDPYLIATAEDIGAILHNDCMACYRLLADVNLAGITWTTAVIPSFGGTFDGNGFTISNLTIRGGDCLGLFGVLKKSAVVKNLKIKDADIVGGNSASDLGILAVVNWGCIADCRITGTISGGKYKKRFGGIVGYNPGTITNCDPIDCDRPYFVIVSDPEAVRKYLKGRNIDFDKVWIPEKTDLDGLDSILKRFLESDESIGEQIWLDREFILDNLLLYNRKYWGFIHNDSKYITCRMIILSGFFVGTDSRKKLDTDSIIIDGGCLMVRLIIDVESKKVVKIECNDVA